MTDSEELLKYMESNGIINLDDIRINIENMKREELLKKHCFNIWQGKNGKWYTYLPDEEKGRIQKSRTTEKALKDLLVDFYKEVEINPLISEVYRHWIDEKMEYNEICKGTFDRYECDFKRYFTDAKISNKKIKSITEEDIELFIRGTIAKFSLTRKGYSGLRTLILGIFKFAKKRNLSKISITSFMGDFELSKNVFRKNIKAKETQVYMQDEIPIITNYLKENPTIEHLGILLAFQTGVRVGELVSLKPSDKKENSIHVQRTEIKYKDPVTNKTVHEVKEFPKTECGDRYVIVTESVNETINKILELNPSGEYLFEKNGRRIYGASFNKRLMSVCKELGITGKSMHKIRKTYGTTLIDANVDESLIMEQMGHKDISTTKKFYYFSNKNEKTKAKQIKRAISI